MSHRDARRIGEKLALSEEQRPERLRRLTKRLHSADGLDRDALRYVEQTGDERRVLRGFDVRRDIDGTPEEVREARSLNAAWGVGLRAIVACESAGDPYRLASPCTAMGW